MWYQLWNGYHIWVTYKRVKINLYKRKILINLTFKRSRNFTLRRSKYLIHVQGENKNTEIVGFQDLRKKDPSFLHLTNKRNGKFDGMGTMSPGFVLETGTTRETDLSRRDGKGDRGQKTGPDRPYDEVVSPVETGVSLSPKMEEHEV